MIKIIYIYILLLVLNCASQGLPEGGPKDIHGPILLKSVPLNKDEIYSYTKIVLEFDERIKPSSIINSIVISPKVEVSVKAKGRKIIIEPLTEWPKNTPVFLSINRNVSDFQLNNIKEEIQLVFNSNDSEYCSISGKLFNASNKIHNIYVYKLPDDDFSSPIKKVNSDIDNNFIINYLKPGKYTVIASEGDLNIYNYRYGISPHEDITLHSDNCNQNINIYIDNPLEKKSITRVETINSKLLNISYSNGVMEPYLLNTNISRQDTLYINIEASNRLEKYQLEAYQYIGKDVLDTIPPFITSIDDSDEKITINFSEPIDNRLLSIEGTNLLLGKPEKLINDEIYSTAELIENEWIDIPYENITPMSIQLQKKTNQIQLFGSNVRDLSGNKMLDSVKVYDLNVALEKPIQDKGAVSSLKGKISNSISRDIVVEAKNISLDLIYADIFKDSLFVFENLSPGKYIFRAYEQKNDINPLIYFSGTLQPYKSAAQFTIHKDTVEVRMLWDVEGVNIEF